ncbi:MAG: gliding motility-associated C-terminal domain-containing protein, partial [Flavobacteriales bacterium]|nr:gliding motility-associated C-terminal domain-containing protein [Flavobacteriales bacterium]
LIVNPVYNQNLGTVSICQGDSALILGNYESVAGTYSDTLTSINGCDSIVSQTLAILSNSSVNLGNDTSICAGNTLLLDAGAGNSYLWQDGSTTTQTYLVSNSGQYFVTVNVGACSASDTINVAVISIPSTYLSTISICQGDSALIFGNYQYSTGNYSDTLISYTNCDSIIVQPLIVNPIYNYNLTPISICQGDSALIFGNYYTVSGTYYDSTTTINGCDSIVAQQLIVNPYHVFSLGNDTTVCQNTSVLLDAGAGADSYIWQSTPLPGYMNQTLSVSTSGTYYVVATIGVCSTSDTINVNVIPTVYTNLNDVEICQGDSALIFGNYESIQGSYNQVLTGQTGCDSILVQNLIVHPNYTIPQLASICQGDSILLGGIYQYSNGIFYDTLQSGFGCDSIVVTTLAVNPIYTTNTTATICLGDSIYLGGSYQYSAGIYTDNFTSIYGCDSTVNTTLSVVPTFVTNQAIDICQGDSIYLGGSYQTTAGVYTDIFISSLGCDSTVNTTLGIKPIASNTLASITICDNDSALIFGNYQTLPGTYSVVIPNGASNGCDSIVYQTLNVNPTYSQNTTATICSGDSIYLGGAYQYTSGIYTDVYSSSLGCDSTIITTLSVVNSFLVNISDTICAGDSIYLSGAYQTTAGVYTDNFVSSGGCDSIVNTTLFVNPQPVVTLTADPEQILFGQSSQLTATGGGTYSWTPSTFLSCSTCPNPVASPEETTLYTVEVNLNGCIVSDTITVTINSEFKIPEGFSPNGDGVNDVFEIVGINQFPENKILIVNRWGDKVFEASPYKSDWDGTSQFGLVIGEKLPTGTYFYVLDLGKKGPTGSQEIKGYIYINR